MSLNDKIGNTAEDLGGRAKEAAGQVTGDEKLRDEGKLDQVEAGAKQAVEDAKDAVGDAVGKLKDKFGK
ncbi:CsbD family protein [Nocardia wallacei]|uniref:CsbD family protein n=1 Tax=Nocardia wallacei TaxID=480035 RepID=UPI0024551F2C|nr:CsbD family protein [Nocardia wallacei]